MISPTATDLLRTIDATLADKVEPSLSDLTGRSALATVRHLLHFIRIRIESEGQAMMDDISAAGALLQKVEAYFRSAGEQTAADAVAAVLESRPKSDPDKYKSLDDLCVETGVLREAIHVALARLQEMRADYREDKAYRTIRGEIRTYMVAEVEQEGEIVAKAFSAEVRAVKRLPKGVSAECQVEAIIIPRRYSHRSAWVR